MLYSENSCSLLFQNIQLLLNFKNKKNVNVKLQNVWILKSPLLNSPLYLILIVCFRYFFPSTHAFFLFWKKMFPSLRKRKLQTDKIIKQEKYEIMKRRQEKIERNARKKNDKQ